MCWVANATFSELKTGFPNYYPVVALANVILDYVIILCSMLYALRKLGRVTIQNLGLVSVSVLFALIVAEVALRTIGWTPGQFQYNKWITPVDSLYAVKGFTSDQHGIYKVDTTVAFAIRKLRHTDFSTLQDWGPELARLKVVHEVGAVFKDHLNLENELEASTEFRATLNQSKSTNASSHFSSVFVNYLKSPINADGFYSIPFRNDTTGKTKVLLLGDSFTWGHTTSNKLLSFSNTLLARGYLMYNTGISGADPAQYQKLLETYMDKIDPDVVVVNFYLGNDVSYHKRTPLSGVPIHFSTNAGNINSFQGGVQFETKEEAYNNVMRNMAVPQTSRLNVFLSKTVVSTLFWQGLVKVGLVDHEYFYENPRPEIPYCNKEVKAMLDFCNSRNKPLILSVIPNLVNDSLYKTNSFKHLFDSLPYNEANMGLNLFSRSDGHFNDEGHLVYANYLQHLIDSTVQQ